QGNRVPSRACHQVEKEQGRRAIRGPRTALPRAFACEQIAPLLRPTQQAMRRKRFPRPNSKRGFGQRQKRKGPEPGSHSSKRAKRERHGASLRARRSVATITAERVGRGKMLFPNW